MAKRSEFDLAGARRALRRKSNPLRKRPQVHKDRKREQARAQCRGKPARNS